MSCFCAFQGYTTLSFLLTSKEALCLCEFGLLHHFSALPPSRFFLSRLFLRVRRTNPKSNTFHRRLHLRRRANRCSRPTARPATAPAARVMVRRLKTPPADLTALAKNNGGKFPAAKVTSILRGQGVPAHGSHEMPVWGPVFWQMSHGHETEVQQRIANLTQYIESLQSK